MQKKGKFYVLVGGETKNPLPSVLGKSRLLLSKRTAKEVKEMCH